MPRINRLAEVCDPETEVVVVGDRNDIVLYRDLKAAGVAEYFFKPLVGSAGHPRAIGGRRRAPQAFQPGAAGAWCFCSGFAAASAPRRSRPILPGTSPRICARRVLLLDLNLHNGDAALQLDAQPSHALREALDDPTRIDELFLERGVANVTKRLCAARRAGAVSRPCATGRGRQ